jgi:DNA-binding response OmpR family regulator
MVPRRFCCPPRAPVVFVVARFLLVILQWRLEAHLSARTAMILIVDDEPSILTLLHDVLTDEGFTVERAQNGQQALALASTKPPDLVVTDLMMPLMDGRALAQRLREHSETSDIPILLISAAYTQQSGDIFTAVLSKPFDIGELVEAIRALLL